MHRYDDSDYDGPDLHGERHQCRSIEYGYCTCKCHDRDDCGCECCIYNGDSPNPEEMEEDDE